jgi:RHS repeat-associated protein
MGYDALGRATAVNSSTLKYDGLGRVVEVAHPSGTLAYAYDAGGNRTTITDDEGKHTYRYDDLNRLTGAQHEAAAAETYSYDAAGNRTGSAADAGYRYDAAGRLAAAEGATLEYDKNGNLARKTTAGGTTRYTWNAENQLARVDLPDGGTAVYKYDAFGRRIEKSVKGVVTTYLYDGNNILLEMDGTGRVTARYTHGRAIDQPLLMEREGRTYFYHADALGSVVALAGAGGNAERRYAYDTWGNPTRAEEAGPANPFLFAGREYDAETGLYYMRARYYDPGTGRFLSPDPLDLAGLLVMGQSPGHEEALLPRAAAWALRGAKPGLMRALRETWQRAPQRLNAYAYAANNPLLLTDPSGLAYTQGQCGKGMDAEDYYQQWLEGCEDADYSECDNYINPLRPTNPWAEVMNPPPLR